MWRRGHRDVTHTKRRKCIKYRIDHGWRRPDRTSLPAALDAEGIGLHGTSWRRMVRRSEEHTSELQSLMRISYAVFCLKKKIHSIHKHSYHYSVYKQLTHHTTTTITP